LSSGSWARVSSGVAGPRILLLAGEVSGDQHGAHVARALRKRWPDARLEGLGGPRMEAEGVRLWEGLDRLAVMGFAEVIRHLPFFFRLRQRVHAELDAGADLVIPIDYPGFNLRIAKSAHEREIPVLYYIAPQVWAWKEGRARRLANVSTGIAVILPFEVEAFEGYATDVRFVGHPLLEEPVGTLDRREFCSLHGLDPERPILALFPGSRRQELDRHLRTFLAAAGRVKTVLGTTQVVLARAAGLVGADFEPDAVDDGDDGDDGDDSAKAGDYSATIVDAVVDDSRLLLRHARAAIVKSGTSTLEAAIEGTPFVTVYKTSPFTYALARRVVKLKYITLANLVAGRALVPELIQDDATPERIAIELIPLLERSGPEREEMVAGLDEVRTALGEAGAAERVAAWAAEILER
jgi:lipid-A-disaccharide synthase